MKRVLISIALLAATCVVHAGVGPVTGTNRTATAAAKLTPSQRNVLVQELGARWGSTMPRGSKRAVDRSTKLLRLAADADDANLLAAVEMPTYEAMLGALQGQSLDASAMKRAIAGGNSPQALGSTIADTVFTPLPSGRCRVADSRVIGVPTAAAGTLEIDVEDVLSYATQGGNGSTAGDGSTLCGLPIGATAYMVSVTVLPVGQDGFFKLFETGKAFSEGSTLLYSPGNGDSNDMIVRSCATCSNELSVYSNAQTHYVLDIVGYFMPPEATALQCTETFVTENVPASFPFDIQIPSCSAGYTMTGAGCRTPGFDEANWAINGLTRPSPGNLEAFCSGLNTTAGVITVEGTAQCCRVPGR